MKEREEREKEREGRVGGERDLNTVALIGHHDAAASIECYAHGAIELGLCRLRRVRHTDAASYLCVCVCVCVRACVCVLCSVCIKATFARHHACVRMYPHWYMLVRTLNSLI